MTARRRIRPTTGAYLDIKIEAGDFSIDAVGFQGKACADLEAIFAEIGEVQSQERKPEYDQAEASVLVHRVHT